MEEIERVLGHLSHIGIDRDEVLHEAGVIIQEGYLEMLSTVTEGGVGLDDARRIEGLNVAALVLRMAIQSLKEAI